MQPPEVIEENRKIAEATGRKLDKLGRLSGGPTGRGHMEKVTYTDPESGVVTHVERRVPPDDIRCTKNVTGKMNPWRGNRCARTKIKGAEVCPTHGGNLPNVRKAAQRKLAMAALPAAERLIHMALKKQRMSDGDRLKALLAILDRAGVEGKSTVELEVRPWQTVLRSIYGNPNGEPIEPAHNDEDDDETPEVEYSWEDGDEEQD